MVKIVEYNEEYKLEDVIKFWIEICIDEYGFEKWRRNIENSYKEDGRDEKLWIAIDNENNIIGTIGIENKGDSIAFLKKVYVKKEYRGSGIAQNLLNIATSFAYSHKYTRIELSTCNILSRAIGFYKKNGFVEKEVMGDVLRFYKNLEACEKEIAKGA